MDSEKVEKSGPMKNLPFVAVIMFGICIGSQVLDGQKKDLETWLGTLLGGAIGSVIGAALGLWAYSFACKLGQKRAGK
ncbi:MAG: hypothetical protein HGB35_00765 [Geobacteraceae bacterium]|nr:hypothetical protein [Geobacteraceae bacterium]